MLKIFLQLSILTFGCFWLGFSGCSAERRWRKQYIVNDSTSLYSTHSSRPFKYGYSLTKNECKEFYEDMGQHYGIKNGDVVADVGGASGWIAGMMSLYVDSVTFYVQDIDTNFLSRDQLNKVVAYYSAMRETPQTNKFICVLGTENKTNLPDKTFDKVMINNAYHEIINTMDIMTDLSYKLKPGGKIIIGDHFSNDYYQVIHPGCYLEAKKLKTSVGYMQWSDLYLTDIVYPENSKDNYITLEKDQKRSQLCKKRRDGVAHILKDADELNHLEVATDSMSIVRITSWLSTNLDTLHSVYRSVETYISTIGEMWLTKKEYKAAINVFSINLQLYPASAWANVEIGEAYFYDKQYTKALKHLNKYIEMKPDDKAAKKLLSDCHVYLNKKK